MQNDGLFRSRGVPSGKVIVWLLIVVLTALAAAGIAARYQGNRDAAAPKQKEAVTLEFAASDVATVELRELSQVIPLTGNLQPLNQTAVRAKVSGEIKEALVREGETVKKGQVLARFDPLDLQARLDERIANLEGARAQLNLAEKNQQSNQDLVKQKFISQNAYDNTRSSYQISLANLKSLAAQVALARNALNDGVVKAPLGGSVARRYVQAGEKVSQDMPLFTIVDLTRMELQAPVPANEIPNVRIGQLATIHVEGHEKRSFSGRVERINPSSEPGSRSINVYIVITNDDRALSGGVFATGVLNLSNSPPVPTIHASAIREENGKHYVYIVENGKLARRAVELGQRSEQDGLVEIRSGIAPGVQVVTARIEGLKSGAAAVIGNRAAVPAGTATPADKKT